jgi:hypothetical protein
VGGYIVGEFGNLITGDQRSSPAVQFRLLHSKYHLCLSGTMALLLTTYVKFINLFRSRLNECLETILNKAQELPKSKKVQHVEAISLIIHNDRYLTNIALREQ